MRCVVALALAGLLPAQEARFGAQTRIVQVPVMVTDGKDRAVEGLDASDFRVFDNGRLQSVTVDSFATGVAPIALVVAVQASNVSAPALDKIRKIGAMIQPLITGERGCAALVTFAGTIEWRQDCTRDGDALSLAFNRLQPEIEKEARILDAASAAIDRLARRPNARRVLLLVSGTRDRGSETDLEAVVAAAQSAGVTIYAATYSAFKTAFTAKATDVGRTRSPKGPQRPGREADTPAGNWERPPLPPPQQGVGILGGLGELGRLAQVKAAHELSAATGGAVFPFTRLKGLERSIEKLSDELTTQYVLSFTPKTAVPGYHRIDVRLTREGDFRIRARPGYWSQMGEARSAPGNRLAAP
ncbi:MAG: VWA domain-containing protein [Bryobacteraceae bacterium]|nr:VWA domain-containing protein [Bryobacteraceae bacterium]